MDKTKLSTKHLLQGALIAAVYAALTIILAPISYGAVQVRVSEALTVLPALTPVATPGLIVGCFMANILGPNGVVDAILGTLATAIAAICSYKLRKTDWLVPLPPVVSNGLIVGAMLHFVYGVPNLWACMGWVALGQLVACYAVGLPLLKLLKKYHHVFE